MKNRCMLWIALASIFSAVPILAPVRMANAQESARRTPVIDRFVVTYPQTGHSFETIAVPGGITWIDAEKAARQHSYEGVTGHLATVASAEKTEFLATHIHSGDLWIGGYQDKHAPDYREPAGGWRWVTGEQFTYLNWMHGEPNNGPPGEDFLQLKEDGTWNDASGNCAGYIIEYDTKPTADVPKSGIDPSIQRLFKKMQRKLQSYSSYSETIELRLVNFYKSVLDTARAELTWSQPNYFRLVGAGIEGKVLAVGDGQNLFIVDRTDPDTYVLAPMPALSDALSESLQVMTSSFQTPAIMGLLSDEVPTVRNSPWLRNAQVGETVEGDDPTQAIYSSFKIKFNEEPNVNASYKLVISLTDYTIRAEELSFRYQVEPYTIYITHTNRSVNPELSNDTFMYRIPSGERVRHLKDSIGN